MVSWSQHNDNSLVYMILVGLAATVISSDLPVATPTHNLDLGDCTYMYMYMHAYMHVHVHVHVF